jgi:hypothetical protein
MVDCCVSNGGLTGGSEFSATHLALRRSTAVLSLLRRSVYFRLNQSSTVSMIACASASPMPMYGRGGIVTD